MAPRTRATASTATNNLAAAPRRRVKVTPLDNEEATKPTKATEQPAARATRSTRSRNTEEPTEEPITKTTKTTTTKATRGRPKKTEAAAQEQGTEKPVEKLAEKPKRATRATRATATTVSSEAKEKKPAAKVSRSKAAEKTKQSEPVVEPEEVPTVEEAAPVTRAARAAPKKRVTFQDIAEDDKENQPLTTRGAKKTAASKSTKASTTAAGLKAKPVRKPATATRASKRTKVDASDDEEEQQKPKKIQRVLTPKRITQVARVATPEDASEDELNGGKSPVRDLSLSPKRPHTSAAAQAVAKTLSPTKKLDFTQSLLQRSAKKSTDADTTNALMSPARRLPTSPAKLFFQSTITSAAMPQNVEPANALASPARRPVMSPIKEGVESSTKGVFGDASKLLFPTAHKTSQIVFQQSTNNLLQSPKRSAAFGPARVFAHSAIKPQKDDLSMRNFFSSPAKRGGLFSPLKKSTTPQSTAKNAQLEAQSPDELELDEMEVTNLVDDHDMMEVSMTSHQRASISPMRLHRVSEDELQIDFDDSILEIRSPLKVARSPIKMASVAETAEEDPSTTTGAVMQDEDMTDVTTSVQSTPYAKSQHERTFATFQDLQGGKDSELGTLVHASNVSDAGDDTIVLPENIERTTPRSVASIYQENEMSMDELAPSPQEDVVAKYLRTPGTPATIREHELTNMLSSPEAESAVAAPAEEDTESAAPSPASLHGNELTMMASAFTPKPAKKLKPIATPASIFEHETTTMSDSAPPQKAASPASLHEHEITMTAGEATPKAAPAQEIAATPASLHENELTMIGDKVTPKAVLVHQNVAATPASIYENELTMMGTEPTLEAAVSPASVHEHELTIMVADTVTPKAKLSPTNTIEGELTTMTDKSSPQAMTPAVSLAEHELTMMGQATPGKEEIAEGNESIHVTSPDAVHSAMTSTPNVPILRKFHLNTIVSKVPLKPEGQESPFKLQMKKLKRPHSLGGQPESINFTDTVAPAKSARTASSPDATSARATAAAASVKSARRVTSALVGRTPLTPAPASDVLSGAVVYCDVRTSEGADASAIYIDLLQSLGAKVIKEWKDNINITHIVYKDGNSKTLEKIRRASLNDANKIKCVGVSWPLDCDAQKVWVDETDYLLNLTSTDHVLASVTRSGRRKSMEPSMLITDGTGSVKRSRSRSRVSMGARRSSVRPLTFTENTPVANTATLQDNNHTGSRLTTLTADVSESTTIDTIKKLSPLVAASIPAAVTPTISTAKKQAAQDKLSLTAAWKSINAPQNLGEDTPARRTLELLQKSYDIEDGWDNSMISSHQSSSPSSNSHDEEDSENAHQEPRQLHQKSEDEETEGVDDGIIETGLTPAPYRMKMQIGSAPPKQNGGVDMMTYRERVEEMERREMRDNAFGTGAGAKGIKRGRGMRVTMFGFEGSNGAEE